MLPVKNSLLPNVSKFFDDDWNTLFDWTNRSFNNSTLPSVNIKENGDHFMVEVAAPGLKKEDFNIELNNNLLIISCEKEYSEEDNNDQFRRREFSYTSFRRTFNLDAAIIDQEKIMARYEDGILYLTLPKKEEAKEKPPRMIKIA